ncbi:hypothetical protein BKG76_15195 [Mycobacteroides franklinii]|uniref:Alpha integrin n=1 Tax=Mycobacteroides franklinii TaxID=948102 RepID=A0A1S1L8Z2_9MYCO|nr:hypothetical protein [Mycobacteroides franklinii]OHU21895.1 hypothetical protein BKG76_15195 [Mycobacteroides franklinii]
MPCSMRGLSAAVAAAALVVSAQTIHPVAVARAALAPCASRTTMIVPETPMVHTDCRLTATDGTGITFDVVYWRPLPDNNEAPDYPPLSVRVTIKDAAGNKLQEVNELLEASSPAPVGLQDIDGDGRDEMIIPMATRVMNGAVNSRFSVWRAEKQTTHFERVQMFGQAIYPSGDGYVVVNSGAFSSRDLDFYLPTAAGYTQIVTLTMTTEEVDPNTRKVLTASCMVHKQSGLGAIDMDWQDSPVFCDSPAAKAIWPDAERVETNRRVQGR